MLSFKLGNIPVTVHAPFLLMALLFGAQLGSDVPLIAAWLVIVFVSVLAHELGHALCGIAFGLDPRIELHGMGGTTSWAHKNVSPAKRIAISVAGPAVGIVVGGALLLARDSLFGMDLSRMARVVIVLLIEVNLYWGLLNLLPILPLDGGNALAHGLAARMGDKGFRVARYVSVVVAAVAGIYALTRGWGLWSVFLAGLFAFQNIRALTTEHRPPPPPMVPQQW